MVKPTKKQRKHQIMQMEVALGIRDADYQGPIPRPKCNCDGYGCFGCCNSLGNVIAKGKAHTRKWSLGTLLTGQIGHIDSFRFIKSRVNANNTLTFRALSPSELYLP